MSGKEKERERERERERESERKGITLILARKSTLPKKQAMI